MNLFLDSSVVIAACGSVEGASAEVFAIATRQGWELIASPYVVSEVTRNVARLSQESALRWPERLVRLRLVQDVFTIDRPSIFEAAKDRPILFTALATSEILLTLDRGDFGGLIGSSFYDLAVLTPGMFLRREREAGRVRD